MQKPSTMPGAAAALTPQAKQGPSAHVHQPPVPGPFTRPLDPTALPSPHTHLHRFKSYPCSKGLRNATSSRKPSLSLPPKTLFLNIAPSPFCSNYKQHFLP